MAEEGFKNRFLDVAKKIPYIKGGYLSSINFTTIYPREAGPVKNVLMARYKIGDEYLEFLLQSPKDAVLENINESKLKTTKLGGLNFYTTYDPRVDYFPSGIFAGKPKLYTMVKDNILTIATENKNHLKLIKTDKFAKPEFRIFDLIKSIPEQISDFEVRFFACEKDMYKDHFMFVFMSSDAKGEIRLEYYEDEKDEIESLADKVKNGKKVDKSTIKGKIEGKTALLYKINKNSILILKLIKGEEKDLVNLASKLTKVFK